MQEPIDTVVLEEHQSEVVVNPPLPPIRVVVSEAPRPTITYSRTVSKNVKLVWNLNKCTYNFYRLVN